MRRTHQLPGDILQQIRAIHIKTNHLVNAAFSGGYESAFRGRGMIFEEVREYLPGDEVRDIDWNVTARFGHPFVKVYREERELTIMLLVDVSASTAFGSRTRLKQELLAEIASVLAFAATKNNDKVGLVLFSDHVEQFIPPQKGSGHVWRLIRAVLGHRPAATGTDITAALEYVNRVIRRRAICFLLSDFLADLSERALRVTCRTHDLIAVTMTDPRERELPAAGMIRLQDAETGSQTVLDCGDPLARRAFARAAAERQARRTDLFTRIGIDAIDIRTDQPYIHQIIRFFKMREHRP